MKRFLPLLCVIVFYGCSLYAAVSLPRKIATTIPTAPSLTTRPVKDVKKIARAPKPLPTMSTIQQAIPNEEECHRFLDVIIIADEDKLSNVFAEYFCAVALLQEAAPIIVSRAVWRRVLKAKISDGDPLFTGINFGRFLIYQGVAGPEWFLIIPKTYRERLRRNNPKVKNDEEKLLGFRTATSSILTTRAQSAMRIAETVYTNPAAFPDFTDVMGKAEVDHLLALFASDIPGVLWNIVITGHGLYPNNLESILTEEGVQAQESGGTQIAGFQLPLYRDILDYFNTKLSVNTVYWTTCYGGDYNLVLPFVPLLVEQKQVDIVEEKKETKTTDDDKVSSVSKIRVSKKPSAKAKTMLLTRSQAGRKFTMIASALTSKVINISSASITSSNISRFAEESVQAMPVIPLGQLDLARYFYALRFYGATSIEKRLQPIKYSTQQLQDILKYITQRIEYSNEMTESYSLLDPYGISSLPSVKLPSWDTFYPVPLDDTIAVITPFTVAKVLVENKLKGGKTTTPSIELNYPNAILLCTPDIPVEIIINAREENLPSIVSMLPGMARHKIDSIKINTYTVRPVPEDLSAKINTVRVDSEELTALFSIFPVFPKFFYIKKFQGYDTIYENILIYVKRDETAQQNKFGAAFIEEQDALESIFSPDTDESKICSSIKFEELIEIFPIYNAKRPFKKIIDEKMMEAQKIVGENKTAAAKTAAQKSYAGLPNGILKLCVARFFNKLYAENIDLADKVFLDSLERIFKEVGTYDPVISLGGIEIRDINRIAELLKERNDVFNPIKELALSSNGITEISGLDGLSELEGLSLGRNKITEIKGLDGLLKLKDLILMDNEITEIKGLDRLTELQTLYLEGNKITEIKGLDRLTNLKYLSLEHNPVCGKPDYNAQIEPLKERGVEIS